jgi:hypothetical protein
LANGEEQVSTTIHNAFGSQLSPSAAGASLTLFLKDDVTLLQLCPLQSFFQREYWHHHTFAINIDGVVDDLLPLMCSPSPTSDERMMDPMLIDALLVAQGPDTE